MQKLALVQLYSDLLTFWWNVTDIWNQSIIDIMNNSSKLHSAKNDRNFALEDGAKVGLILLYSIATSFSIVGNVIVIAVFIRGRRCRTDIRPFLLNLAVADLLMAIFCMPFTSTYVMMGSWAFPKRMCPAVLSVQHVAVSASVFTNMAIGMDRLIVVRFPLKSKVMLDRTKYVLAFIWLGALGLGSVQLFVSRAIEYSTGNVMCNEQWSTAIERQRFTVCVFFFTFLLPLTILAVTYSVVGYILWRRTSPGNSEQIRDHHQLQAKRKVTMSWLSAV